MLVAMWALAAAVLVEAIQVPWCCPLDRRGLVAKVVVLQFALVEATAHLVDTYSLVPGQRRAPRLAVVS